VLEVILISMLGRQGGLGGFGPSAQCILPFVSR